MDNPGLHTHEDYDPYDEDRNHRDSSEILWQVMQQFLPLPAVHQDRLLRQQDSLISGSSYGRDVPYRRNSHRIGKIVIKIYLTIRSYRREEGASPKLKGEETLSRLPIVTMPAPGNGHYPDCSNSKGRRPL